MSGIKVRCEVKIYETDGIESVAPHPTINVESHWPLEDRVVLLMPNGTRYTVLVNDMENAIDNAANHQ